MTIFEQIVIIQLWVIRMTHAEFHVNPAWSYQLYW